METIGEGIGGLLMTFVEGLANMFSFLRVAAFAIAHVSLSGAGESMGHAINNPLVGMIIMNVIALCIRVRLKQRAEHQVALL